MNQVWNSVDPHNAIYSRHQLGCNQRQNSSSPTKVSNECDGTINRHLPYGSSPFGSDVHGPTAGHGNGFRTATTRSVDNAESRTGSWNINDAAAADGPQNVTVL